MTPTHEAAFETVIETHLLDNGYVPVMAGMAVRLARGQLKIAVGLNGFAVRSGVRYYPMRANEMNPNLRRREVF